MANGKTNNITKQEALSWLHDNRNRFTPDYNARRLFEVTVLGRSYDDDYGRSMSTLCRAYSITQYGSSSNRIRNIYKKYLNRYNQDQLRYAINQIVSENPHGIDMEYPYFEERLTQLLAGQVYVDPPIQQNQYSDLFTIEPDYSSYSPEPDSEILHSRSSQESEIPNIAVVGVIAVIIACYIFRKPLGRILYYLFWGLELLLFYGGIIFCIIMLVKKRPKSTLILGLSMIVYGLSFGLLMEGAWIHGLISIGFGTLIYYGYTYITNR